MQGDHPTLQRFDDPSVLRTLFHLAYFIQRTRPLD